MHRNPLSFSLDYSPLGTAFVLCWIKGLDLETALPYEILYTRLMLGMKVEIALCLLRYRLPANFLGHHPRPEHGLLFMTCLFICFSLPILLRGLRFIVECFVIVNEHFSSLCPYMPPVKHNSCKPSHCKRHSFPLTL